LTGFPFFFLNLIFSRQPSYVNIFIKLHFVTNPITEMSLQIILVHCGTVDLVVVNWWPERHRTEGRSCAHLQLFCVCRSQ